MIDFSINLTCRIKLMKIQFKILHYIRQGSFMIQMKILLIFLIVLMHDVCAIYDIEQFGAISNSDTLKSQFINQKAITDAILAASKSSTQRIVRIPSKTFYTMPIRVQNASNLTIQILGKLTASKSVRYWPRDESHRHWNFLQFNNCQDLQISGGGKIDGRGYHWWMLVFLNDKKLMNNQDDRPHMFNLVNCTRFKVHDLILKNSATFHMKIDHSHQGQIFNLDIKVNTTAQLNLMKKFSLQGLVPMFPFNTDGVDPSGADMYIHNLTVQNFDDVVVPKPSHDDDCTRNIFVENIQVRLGVGMSIGSVPPHEGGSCIRNVTFRNVVMKRPFKGIYVKTNPGSKGWGNVTDIYYKNISMDRPIWWAIYLGPQQMRMPGGAGPGCMIYPFDPKGTCETQPRVTIKNITLQDIRIHKSLLYPVTLRCNVSNPCTEINFINVKVDEWEIGQKQKGFVCEFVTGKSSGTFPKIDCLNDDKVDNNDLRTQTDYLENREHITDDSMDIKRMIRQMQEAVKEIPYEDSDDDDFTYSLDDVLKEFRSVEKNEAFHQQ